MTSPWDVPQSARDLQKSKKDKKAPLKEVKKAALAEAEELLKSGVLTEVDDSVIGETEESLADRNATGDDQPAVVEPEPVLLGKDPYIEAASQYAIDQAEALERNRDPDPVYESVLVKFILDTERYRNARREMFHRLEMDRGEMQKAAETKLKALRIKSGRPYDDSIQLGLSDILEMKEFQPERDRMKQLFRDVFFQASQVEEFRKEMMRNQKRFRDTNDAVVRHFMNRAADPGQAPLREVKMLFPIGSDYYLEETSEEDFQQGKGMTPADQAVMESINFFKEEAKNVPPDFLEGLKM